MTGGEGFNPDQPSSWEDLATGMGVEPGNASKSPEEPPIGGNLWDKVLDDLLAGKTVRTFVRDPDGTVRTREITLDTQQEDNNNE